MQLCQHQRERNEREGHHRNRRSNSHTAGAAVAQSANGNTGEQQLTRSDVIANLEIYIQSGLRDLGMLAR